MEVEGAQCLDSEHEAEMKYRSCRRGEVEEIGMTVGSGALSSWAQRNCQASFGRRQVVEPGGDSGPPQPPGDVNALHSITAPTSCQQHAAQMLHPGDICAGPSPASGGFHVRAAATSGCLGEGGGSRSGLGLRGAPCS